MPKRDPAIIVHLPVTWSDLIALRVIIQGKAGRAREYRLLLIQKVDEALKRFKKAERKAMKSK